MKIITRDKVVYVMDKKNPPVETANSGERVVFQTCDCFNNAIRKNTDMVSGVDFSRVNPATGPLYINGAEPGDTLMIRVLSISLDVQGAAVAAPGLGRLGAMVEREETVICPIEGEYARYLDYRIPLRKMIGVVGTAPAGEAVVTATPGAHGGNLDTTAITEGVSLYLPVNVPGALLAIGDLHASMGDGEIMGAALEISGEVEVEVSLLKNCDYPLPLLETEDRWITIASAATAEEASDRAIRNMVDLLRQKTGLSFNQAGMLLSLAGDLRVSQIVNPRITMRLELSKRYFA
ncbi:MAG: acetamidase/formamidase family protein [Clostridiaceae bacterium]|nr:acetamidase/formamidase family protein [Clostridiaceae bacterium]